MRIQWGRGHENLDLPTGLGETLGSTSLGGGRVSCQAHHQIMVANHWSWFWSSALLWIGRCIQLLGLTELDAADLNAFSTGLGRNGQGMLKRCFVEGAQGGGYGAVPKGFFNFQVNLRPDSWAKWGSVVGGVAFCWHQLSWPSFLPFPVGQLMHV